MNKHENNSDKKLLQAAKKKNGSHYDVGPGVKCSKHQAGGV
jgi:hypothetical protein